MIYKDSLGARTKAVEYQYDGLGRRIGKSVDENGDGFMDRSQTFVYDGAGLLAASGGSIQISGPNGQLNQHGWVDGLVLVFEDADGDGSASSILSSRLLYGPAVDQVFAMESAAADVLWALTDHQGTVRDWVESADFNNDSVVETQVINHLIFDAFGNLQSVTDNTGQPTTLDSRLTILPAYTGQLYDADAGLHYYRARWYDSATGQFIQEDPLSFLGQQSNLRVLLANNPVHFSDPSGLRYWDPATGTVLIDQGGGIDDLDTWEVHVDPSMVWPEPNHESLVDALVDLLPPPVTSGAHTCSETTDIYVNALCSGNGHIFVDFERVDYNIYLHHEMPFGFPWLIVWTGTTTGHAAVEVELVDGSKVLVDNGGLSGNIATEIDDVPPWFIEREGPAKPFIEGIIHSPMIDDIREGYEENLRPNSGRPWWGPHGKF